MKLLIHNLSISWLRVFSWDWNSLINNNAFTYSKCLNSIQFVVFGSSKNSSYLTRTYAASLSLLLSLHLSLTSLSSSFSSTRNIASEDIIFSETPNLLTPKPKNAPNTNYIFSWKKLLPSAGIEPGSSQSKIDYTSHSTMVNPQTERLYLRVKIGTLIK